MNAAEANGLLEAAERLVADGQRLRTALEWEFLSKQITEVIDEDYDLGRVTRVEQILGGFVNLSFAVWTEDAAGAHRFFVRKYNQAIREHEVRFEHALVNHVVERGLHIAAKVHAGRAGVTLAAREETAHGERVKRFFAVYDCLEGEDRYSWVNNRLTDKEYAGAARVLAQFHHCGSDFDPGNLRREQPPIMELLPTLAPAFEAFARQAAGTAFDEYFLAKLPQIREVIARGGAIAAELAGLPFIPVHCDYHAGNLKYAGEADIVGLFDFDWSKLDYRVFDLGLALSYFCDSWEGADAGELRLGKVELFLAAYQEESARWGDPGPLAARELALLPRMIANGNLFVLNWDLADYYGDREPNVEEYLVYLKHNAMVLEFIEGHFDQLTTLCSRAAPR